MAEKITAEVKTYEGTGFVVSFVVIGGSYSGGMPPDIAAEVARRINCAEALAEACASSDAAFEVLYESIRKIVPSPTALYLIEGQRQAIKIALAAYRGTE